MFKRKNGDNSERIYGTRFENGLENGTRKKGALKNLRKTYKSYKSFPCFTIRCYKTYYAHAQLNKLLEYICWKYSEFAAESEDNKRSFKIKPLTPKPLFVKS